MADSKLTISLTPYSLHLYFGRRSLQVSASFTTDLKKSPDSRINKDCDLRCSAKEALNMTVQELFDVVENELTGD